ERLESLLERVAELLLDVFDGEALDPAEYGKMIDQRKTRDHHQHRANQQERGALRRCEGHPVVYVVREAMVPEYEAEDPAVEDLRQDEEDAGAAPGGVGDVVDPEQEEIED